MKIFTNALSTIAFCMILSCSTSNIKVSNDLKNNADIYQVQGNNGILINKKITFGGYNTSPVKRGFITSTRFSILGLNKEKSEQVNKFFMYAPDGKSADIFAMNIYKNNEFDLLKGFEKYFTSFENGFIAMIAPENNQKLWKVYISNDISLSATKQETDYGYAIDDEGNEIKINGTKYLEEDKFLVDNTKTFGFELVQNGKSIGAVSVIGNGKVWIDKNLSSDMKLVVASIAASLMVKKDLNKELNK